VLVPALFWWGTWFGNRLDDDALLERLSNDANPRYVQHAVNEIAQRLDEGRPGMDRWADELVRVSAHADRSVRIAAAWAMQHGTPRDAFLARLTEMAAEDPAPLVRRNAATSLAALGDPAGRPVLAEMLSDHVVSAPLAGRAEPAVTVDLPVQEGMLLARIDLGDGRTAEVRAELPGRVTELLVEDEAEVAKGAPLVRVAPSTEHVRNAVIALVMVGTEADLDLLRPWADPRSGAPDDVSRAATAAIAAIESRLGR